MNSPDFHLQFGTELMLRPVRPEDARVLFQLVDSNRDHLRRFMGWVDHNQSEEDTLAFIRNQQERQGFLTLGIWYRNTLVGLIGLQNIDILNRSATTGYWLDEKHQGKGIMRRSVRAIIDYCRYALKLHRFEVRCAVENTRSQAIPLALGFQQEGLLRDVIYLYGDYLDAYQYSLILEDDAQVLETERLVLRKLSMDDTDHLLRMFSDPEAMRFYPGTRDLDETKVWIQKVLESYATRGYCLWACHLRETGEFVGQCGLIYWENIAGQEEVEIGYMFVRQHWKKGLATEAAKACLKYAREILGRQRLISLIQPENFSSRAVAERLGMKVEKEAEVMGFHVLVHSIG